jgi:ATPase subunit of ABC transporter with duplicated ATPase domains
LSGYRRKDVRHHPGIRIVYLAQEPRYTDLGATAADGLTDGLRADGSTAVTDEARGWLLRSGLLTRDDIRKRVRELSIGQHRKLELGIPISCTWLCTRTSLN